MEEGHGRGFQGLTSLKVSVIIKARPGGGGVTGRGGGEAGGC